MWFQHAMNATFRRLESLDFNQVVVLLLIVVAFGWFCLRGF